MLYQLTINFQKAHDWFQKQDAYYAILGAVLNLFHNDEAVYHAICKLSFSISEEEFMVMITINGEKYYNYIVQILMKSPSQELSVNGVLLSFKNIRLDFKIFDPELVEYQAFSKFQLKFYSPSFLRQENIIYALPQPDQFLISVRDKIEHYYPQLQLNLEEKKKFKKWIKRAIYVGEFKLKTELIHIKKNKKSWVVGYCHYYLNLEMVDNPEYLHQLYLLLQAIRFVGIGSGVKLWCGNVGCFIR